MFGEGAKVGINFGKMDDDETEVRRGFAELVRIVERGLEPHVEIKDVRRFKNIFKVKEITGNMKSSIEFGHRSRRRKIGI